MAAGESTAGGISSTPLRDTPPWAARTARAARTLRATRRTPPPPDCPRPVSSRSRSTAGTSRRRFVDQQDADRAVRHRCQFGHRRRPSSTRREPALRGASRWYAPVRRPVDSAPESRAGHAHPAPAPARSAPTLVPAATICASVRPVASAPRHAEARCPARSRWPAPAPSSDPGRMGSHWSAIDGGPRFHRLGLNQAEILRARRSRCRACPSRPAAERRS